MLMSRPVVLASGSPTRLAMLRSAGIDPIVAAVRIDEQAIRAALQSEGVPPKDIAGHLADLKAQRAAVRHPDAWIIAADQVLDIDGEAVGKPTDRTSAHAQLGRLSGAQHRLHSAVVVYEGAQPVWRHVGQARLTMRQLSDPVITAYLDHIGDEAYETAGSYRIEGYGIRLFKRVDGDHFTILGMPLLPLIDYLMLRQIIAP
jgi:septum formation protein